MTDVNGIEENEEVTKNENGIEPASSDEEDDCEGYFLEPTGNNINIAEKIAEANQKLLEEEEDDEDRPRKVQFSEELINFEPTYYSDEDNTESTRNSVISEEDVELKLNNEEETHVKDFSEATTKESSLEYETIPEENPSEEQEDEIEEVVEESVADLPSLKNPEDVSEELNSENLTDGNSKLLLVLLPKDQNSSCESIIGEEIKEDKKTIPAEDKKEEKSVKTKFIRPKSAKKSCEVSKISPNLNYTFEKKCWQGRTCCLTSKTKSERNEKKVLDTNIRVEIKGRVVKKINLNLEGLKTAEELKRCCDNRPKSSVYRRMNEPERNRPQTAPMKRTCFVLKTELPNYNGLRSEYGLSAQQLEERKQKTLELKLQKQKDKILERQEELRKKNENEEMFQRWLFNKTKKTLSKKPAKVDTLTRSDVYIQTHASYAANKNVPYSVDYNLHKKTNHRKSTGKRSKTILIEKLLKKVKPNLKRSFNIYLGGRL